jgi:hypothetical protein
LVVQRQFRYSDERRRRRRRRKKKKKKKKEKNRVSICAFSSYNS